jgi:antirestriction protein ArdC
MTKQAKQNVYERVTNKIVEGLKKDGLKWFRPWTANGIGMPINNATGKAYRGVNVLLLSASCHERGFEHNEWLTYKQCTDKGGNVKKGAKSEFVIYWSVSFVTKDGKWFPNEEALKKAGLNPADCEKRFSAKWFNVFNIAECEGIEPKFPKVEHPENTDTPIEAAEAIFNNYPNDKRPTLTHGGSKACYIPSQHAVHMPKFESFKSADAYYATLFHELVHSTGHADCLNRAGVAKCDGFGTERYAKEELVAEIGSQFLVAITGIECDDDNSQAYVNGWIAKLENDSKLALSAAQQAMNAVDFITQ